MNIPSPNTDALCRCLDEGASPLPSTNVHFHRSVFIGNDKVNGQGRGGEFTEIENKELIGITIIIESSKDEHLGGMNHSSVSPSSLCCFSFRNNFLLSPSNFSVVREKNELAGGENESKQ